jgi:hypothetical protein
MIAVNEEPINLDEVQADENTITWALVAPGWTFTRNKGIDIKRGSDVWRFGVQADREYSATARKNGRIYKYWINIENATENATFTWDPTIMN